MTENTTVTEPDVTTKLSHLPVADTTNLAGINGLTDALVASQVPSAP